MLHAVLSLLSGCAVIKKIEKRHFYPHGSKDFLAETKKMVKTANDKKFFRLGSELSKTDDDDKAIRNGVGNRSTATSRTMDSPTHSLNYFADCVVHTKHFCNLVFKVENYISYLNLVYTHLRAYRSAIVSYRSNLYFPVSSLSSDYVTPNFLTNNHLAEIVHELTMKDVHCGTKLTPSIQVNYETTFYEIYIVLHVCIIASGISVVLGISLYSKSATFNILREIPLYQHNQDDSASSLYQIRHEYLAFATDESHYAKLGVATLQQCSGTTRANIRRKGFSNTADVNFLCLTSIFCNFSFALVRNSHVDYVLSPDAPQALCLADGFYHVISREGNLPLMKHTASHGTRNSAVDFQACVNQPACSSKLTLNHGDLVSKPDMNFCETRPEPFAAKLQLAPSLQKVFEALPLPVAELNMYSHSAVCKSVVTTSVHIVTRSAYYGS